MVFIAIQWYVGKLLMKAMIFTILVSLFVTSSHAQSFVWDATGNKPKLDVPAGTGIGIGDVANGKYFSLDRYGRYTAIGDSAVAWDEIVVRPQAVRVNPVNTKPDYGTWVFPAQSYMFDAAAAESLYFQVEIHHAYRILTIIDPPYKAGSSLYPHVHWAPMTTDTGTVAWKLAYMVRDVNGTFAFSAGDTLSVRDAGDGTAYKHQLASFPTLDMTSVTDVSAVITGVLIRDAALNSDTYTGEAVFLDLGFHFQVDSFGSRWEFLK